MKKVLTFICLFAFVAGMLCAFSTTALADDIVITKNPTGEEAEVNGSVIFIAKAENYYQLMWHLVSPDGETDYGEHEIADAFPDIITEGFATERLKLSNIPEELQGWKVRAEFINDYGSVFSDEALITLRGVQLPEDEEPATETPAAPPQPESSENTIPEGSDEEELPEENGSIEQEAVQPEDPDAVTQINGTGSSAPSVEFDIVDAGSISGSEAIVRNITVVALWNEASLGAQPDMVYADLYRNGVLYMTAALSKENDWTYTFTYLSNGHYQLTEVPVDDFVIAYGTSGNTITIMHNYIGIPVSGDTAADGETANELLTQKDELAVITNGRERISKISDVFRNMLNKIPRDRRSILVSAASGILVIAAVLCISMFSHKNKN